MTGSSATASARLSACLIVQDEQEHLPHALASLGFCDEIVVADGGSTDHTLDIARAAGANVVENPWPGFAAQRNVALDAATCDWVLELDADERVTAGLRRSIEEFLASPPEGVAMAVLPLRHRFLGRLLGPSAKYPAYRSRLFRREAYRHDESRGVHEGLEPLERPVALEGDLEHILAVSLSEALRDAWSYAKLESGHLGRPRNPGTYLKGILLRPAAKVLYRTVVDEGWRDGWQGILKIFLDASSDALVWVRVLMKSARGLPVEPSGPIAQGLPFATGNAGDRHFGRRPAGRPKVVAIAAQGKAAQTALVWLSGLQAQGVDVALVCTEQPDHEVPIRRVGRLGPLATMRALDVEMQLRTIHAVVPFGQRARLVWHLLPGTLRPGIPGLDATSDPTQPVAESSAQATRRGEPGGCA